MFGFLDAIKIGAGAAVGGLLVALIGLPIAHSNGQRDGRATLQSEIATAAAKAEKERVADDAALSKLSDYALCVRALGDQRMPVSACEHLRGLQAQ
ncbi:MAG: hypothetical protein EOP20_00830 [Hyphomicrobiales bacterium]|nr:MAG: hypothetical protein EOP20_00830 [Hyphomicrobiales bacterium]